MMVFQPSVYSNPDSWWDYLPDTSSISEAVFGKEEKSSGGSAYSKMYSQAPEEVVGEGSEGSSVYFKARDKSSKVKAEKAEKAAREEQEKAVAPSVLPLPLTPPLPLPLSTQQSDDISWPLIIGGGVVGITLIGGLIYLAMRN